MWVEPKTNWKREDFFNIGDYNRIKGNLNEIGSRHFPSGRISDSRRWVKIKPMRIMAFIQMKSTDLSRTSTISVPERSRLRPENEKRSTITSHL